MLDVTRTEVTQPEDSSSQVRNHMLRYSEITTHRSAAQDTGTIQLKHGTSETRFVLKVPFLRLIELSELFSHPTRTL